MSSAIKTSWAKDATKSEIADAGGIPDAGGIAGGGIADAGGIAGEGIAGEGRMGTDAIEAVIEQIGIESAPRITQDGPRAI